MLVEGMLGGMVGWGGVRGDGKKSGRDVERYGR